MNPLALMQADIYRILRATGGQSAVTLTEIAGDLARIALAQAMQR